VNVLYVIPGLGIGGGAERSLLDLAPGLRDNGIDLSIVYFHERPSDAAAAFRAHGVSTELVTASGLVGRVRAVRRAIRRQRPDVVHTTLFEADVVGRLAALGLPPTVVSGQVSTPYAPARRFDHAASRWRVAVARTVDALTLRLRCDRVLANSDAVREEVIERLHVAPERITVVRRGRRPEDFGPVEPARRAQVRDGLGVGPDDPVLLMVGRQEPTKDHRTLVAAMPEVLAAHPGAVLVLVGREGSASTALAEQIRALGIEGSVRQLGFRTDVADLLGASDVFVFPSTLEGLPGAVIEAMAGRVPIVAADIAPVRELVDARSAILVPVRDPGALAAAVNRTLDDPGAARARAEAAWARFDASFTLDQALRETVEFYRSIGPR
jgi:glycosyltransferase involved in cell wall biosynthesis